MNQAILLLLGILILLLGRRLFWLSVAALGFTLGVQMAPELFPHQPEIYVMAFGIFLGILGALLALLLQKIAISVAGFFFGGHLSVVLGHAFAIYRPEYFWLFFVTGGVLGAILMAGFFDWTLIFLSSILGAQLIVDALHFTPAMKLLCFVILAAVGIVFQASLIARRRPVVK